MYIQGLIPWKLAETVSIVPVVHLKQDISYENVTYCVNVFLSLYTQLAYSTADQENSFSVVLKTF